MSLLSLIISFLSLLFIVGACVYEWRCSIWRILADEFSTSKIKGDNQKYEILYFWKNDENENKKYFNAMSINIINSGIGIYPPAFKFWIAPIVIPWDRISLKGSVKIENTKKAVVSVYSSEVSLAFPKRFIPLIEKHCSVEVK